MKKNLTLFFFGLSLFVSAPFFGFSQPDIPMNPELKSNCMSWKVTVKQNGVWGKKPAMVSFGPMKTISTGTGKYSLSEKQADVELFWKNVRTIKSRESSMELEMGDADTSIIRMLTLREEITKEKNAAGTLVHINEEGEESYQDSSWIDEMIIQFSGDSSCWHYRKLESGAAFGVLENISDKGVSVFLHKVNNLEGKKMKEIIFSQPAIGFIFEYRGKQVAAIQTLLKQKIWVSNSLDPVMRTAVMATAAAIIATLKSGDPNGY